MEIQNLNFEVLAHEGIRIDFEFNSDKPTFGDLFLIVGFENPNQPHNSREFEKLAELEFEQVDDYFGIRNKTEVGDDVKIWLFPIINGEEVYHNQGPFDAIRITYRVLGNDPKTAKMFEKTFHLINSNLDVTPTFEGKRIENFGEINEIIIKTIQYCKEELKVEPGSEEALQLDW
ncbi:hypothetical protein F7018_00025 [Tenacibaculum aiptasiae]|uniref:Uncharacterized protein n=1 Tax=Tenacibaculum aiptasiae TaxID=426481 RepID=A0A7J5ATF4_9FLAO|nr:hypothetical protein [Tenacibaculum aiptasiae]KAB1160936.1 hypothetical protein F7018_00025 [Tenacibaculum aiptasiae]